MDACQSIYNGGNDAGSKINNIIKQAIKGVLESEYPKRGMCDILKHELELTLFSCNASVPIYSSVIWAIF